MRVIGSGFIHDGSKAPEYQRSCARTTITQLQDGTLMATCRLDKERVGSDRSALRHTRDVGFSGPPSEPDVRVTTHPALHKVPCDRRVLIRLSASQGEGIRADR